jgi:hypothetical protein
METAQFLTLAGLSVVSIGLCIYLLTKVRTLTYLLEQPVVKKMSPQLKLKPVKVDELDDSRAAVPPRNSVNGAPQNRGPRPAVEGERPRENRDMNPRDRAPRGDRPEGEARREGGDRGERMDRGPRNDRGDRGDRFGGRDRERGGRHERNDRGDRFNGREGAPARDGAPSREGGRERGREGFGSEREPSAAPAASNAPAADTAPAMTAAPASSVLAPRRPLPSTVVDQETSASKESHVDALAPNPTAEDALFTRDDSDIQHGRRNQLKKKPRFDVKEEEVKEETKAL